VADIDDADALRSSETEQVLSCVVKAPSMLAAVRETRMQIRWVKMGGALDEQDTSSTFSGPRQVEPCWRTASRRIGSGSNADCSARYRRFWCGLLDRTKQERLLRRVVLLRLSQN